MIVKAPEVKQVETYPYREVEESNPFMVEAKKEARDCATDRQQPTGAVIVKDGEVFARAANQVPLKIEWLMQSHNRWCARRFFKVKSGTHYWLCPGCSKKHNHAESKAVEQAIKNGVDCAGADLYLYGHYWCCDGCTKAMREAGIADVFVVQNAKVLFRR